MSEREIIAHPIPPFIDGCPEILILGSFPSVLSRKEGFFYGNPRNRFWQVLSAVFECPAPVTIPQKKAFLAENGIALWDVIASCGIDGSSDSSISDARPNDIPRLIGSTGIKKIFLNGSTAKKYFDKFIAKDIAVSACLLPSTSPANASFGLERLISEWQIIGNCK